MLRLLMLPLAAALVSSGVAAGLLVLAGWNIRNLRGYNLAVFASVVAMLPCHGGFLFGLPLGIWALLVLTRPGMRAAFDQAQASRELTAKKTVGKSPIDGELDDVVRRRVRSCAWGLRFSGIIDLAAWAVVTLMCAVKTADDGFPPPGLAMFLSAIALRQAAGALVLLGAGELAQFRSQPLAWIGAVVSIIPLSPGWLLGLPCGLWAMYLLTRPDVRREFERTSQKQPPAGATAMRFVASGFFGAVALTLALFVVASLRTQTLPHTRVMVSGQATAPTTTGPANPNDPVEWIDDRPQLSRAFLDSLVLSDEQSHRVNVALAEAYQAYRDAISDQISRSVDGEGYHVVTIRALPGEVRNRLEDRFWSQVDEGMHSDFQRREMRRLISLTRIVQSLDQGVTVAYRKIGAFYRWRMGDLQTLHMAGWNEDPRLPGMLHSLLEPSPLNEDEATATPSDNPLAPREPATPVEPMPATPVKPMPATPVKPMPATPVEPMPATPVEPMPATPVEPMPATPVEPMPATPVEPMPPGPQ